MGRVVRRWHHCYLGYDGERVSEEGGHDDCGRDNGLSARRAPPNSYINLMADVDGFYEKWGFVPSLLVKGNGIEP